MRDLMEHLIHDNLTITEVGHFTKIK
jgi:hypothetical protein